MSKNSPIRMLKRKAMQNAGATFSSRVREAVRHGAAVRNVNFDANKTIKKSTSTVKI